MMHVFSTRFATRSLAADKAPTLAVEVEPAGPGEDKLPVQPETPRAPMPRRAGPYPALLEPQLAIIDLYA